MTSTHSALIATAVLWLVAGMAPAAANPSVTSTDPKSLYVCVTPYSPERRVTLYGPGLVAPDTTGYTINSDVRIMVRHWPGAFAPALLRSWTSLQLGVELRCADFSQTTPGSLDFQVFLRGTPSNVFTIPLLALPGGPPTLISVSPNQRVVGLTGRLDYLVRVLGTNMPDDTTATIGGEGAGIGLAGFTDGYMDIWVPADLRSKPGVYAVQLHDSKGASNTVNLTIGRLLPTLNRSFTRLGAGTLASLQALQALDVQIINVAGHVTLKGHAGSLEAKAQLIDAVRHIPGVANVVDQVTVP